MLIFSKEKYLDNEGEIPGVSWLDECDGREVKGKQFPSGSGIETVFVVCGDKGDYWVSPGWCIEKTTNFDRITASPEKLVEYIMNQPCSDHQACCDCWGYEPGVKCGAKMIEWLNQEVDDADI